MRPPEPLPPELRGIPLTSAVVRNWGISPSRLRRSDIIPLGSGVYVPRALTESVGPETLFRLRAAGVLQDFPDSWLSHSTVLRLKTWPYPRSLATDDVHVSVSLTRPARIRRRGIIGHQSAAQEQDLVLFEGLRMSSPERTWLDMTPHLSVSDLVVLGDWLVRRPRPQFERRTQPFASTRSLTDAITARPRVTGIARAQKALGLIRVGADSPAETKLRLALVSAGLPEPELQVPANPQRWGSPRADMGYPQWKIVIQYEGSTHFSKEQLRSDHRRDNAFFSEGWLVLKFNSEDYHSQFIQAVFQVRSAIQQRGILL